METTTVRARTTTRDRLVEIGRRRGLSMPDLLEELVARAEGDDLLEAANRHFTDNRDEHDAQIAEWDGVAGDGVDRA
jgi:hypothetical protein